MALDGKPALRRGRLLHLRTRVPATVIAEVMGVTVPELKRIGQAEGWPERPRRRPRGRGRAASAGLAVAAAVGGQGQPSRRDTVALLETLIAGRLRAYVADAAASREIDPERLARAVTQLVRALVMARRHLSDLETERMADDAGPPARSLAELRDELRGHLQRIRLEGRARRGLPETGPEPD